MRELCSIILTAWIIAFWSGFAFGEEASTQDHYKTVINKKPYQVEICEDVAVSGDKTADVLTGAIIGGAIGNNIKGEKNGGAIGAILGGMLGHANSSATGGTKRQCVVETRYNEESVEVYSHSTVTFTHEGRTYTLRFTK
jgi:outer membrane lipoprotein SlyB